MRRIRLFPKELLLLLVSVLVMGGCGSSERTKFYILQPVTGPAAQYAGLNEMVVGIGPVRFPEYLTRSQIVTRTGGNSLDLAEFDRWAEPLDQNFIRVVGEDLSSQLPVSRIVMFPWEKSVPVRYHVKIDVARFNGEYNRRAVLEVRWSVLKGGKEIAAKHSTFEKSLTDSTYGTLVAAESQAVADLSTEIADAISNDVQSAQ